MVKEVLILSQLHFRIWVQTKLGASGQSYRDIYQDTSCIAILYWGTYH